MSSLPIDNMPRAAVVALQAKFDELHKRYLQARGAQDRGLALSLARELADLTKGTDLEQRQQQVLARELRASGVAS